MIRISGGGHEVHVIFNRFSWNLQPCFLYRISPSLVFPSLASFHPFTSIYPFVSFRCVCFVIRDSWFSMPCFPVGLRLLLFIPYGILPEMCLPFVFLTLDHFAPRLGP
jgi:hypothetical protein